MEVAFNHGEATAWNLMKPVIASEINHVEQEFQTEIGIVIVASSNLKRIAGMDNAVKTFEEMKNFLKPLMAYLTVPILIIGLKEPKHLLLNIFQNPTVTGTKKLLGVLEI